MSSEDWIRASTCSALVLRCTIRADQMKDTTISFKIERALKAKLVALSKAENRTLSNLIEKILKEEIAKHESKHGRIKVG